MPYSNPSHAPVQALSAPTSAAGAGRPNHRRAWTHHSYTFAADTGSSGAFASLGSLPRRQPVARPRFHLHQEDESDNTSSDTDEGSRHAAAGVEEDDEDGSPPPLKLRVGGAFKLTPPTPPGLVHRHTHHGHVPTHGPQKRSPLGSPRVSPTPSSAQLQSQQQAPPRTEKEKLAVDVTAVPFPRSSPLSSPFPGVESPTIAEAPARPSLPPRTSSHPIILSNGKPLKSSLKGSRSSSTPNIPAVHLRSRSAPATPSLSSSSLSEPGTPDEDAWETASQDSSTPKVVHFPDAGLETVLLFKRSARPASVSLPIEDETETETDTDRDLPRWADGIVVNGPPTRKTSAKSPLGPGQDAEGLAWRYVIHAPDVGTRKMAEDMVRLEKLDLVVPGEDGSISLSGTLVARNAMFEKHLFVRFTLDAWATTSEVRASWMEALPHVADEPGPNWDRFSFSIRLTDYASATPRGVFPPLPPPGTTRVLSGEKMSALGEGRVGRGLAGRSIVLVVRYWTPWVDAAGVAPYQWVKNSLAYPESEAIKSAVEPSSHSVPGKWIGTGGAGPGEWWDNNGGKNYEVGFIVEHVSKPLAVQNAIPFPSAPEEAQHQHELINGHPVSPVASSLRALPIKVPSDPPPPPARTAHAQALAAKLGRLNLRNYAAPSSIARSSSLPGGWSPAQSHLPPPQVHSPPAKQAETGSGSLPRFWPWAPSTSAPVPSLPAVTPETVAREASTDSVSSSADSSDEEDAPGKTEAAEPDTPPTSPLGAAGLLPAIDSLSMPGLDSDAGSISSASSSPPMSSSPPSRFWSMGTSDPAATPMNSRSPTENLTPLGSPLSPGVADSSSSLYEAFVKQWCFAGTPS
ncbi:unnamed protein product [Mycena citricolor]|uniref:CBM21 domain-containing protein n=1 Tax=Mycena citricolor TaxID=2018698 RepID=A0AAD2H1G1_9AGAR|nr:unnamed protein product [Mycena citricolor]CAK5265922.1 unnamed protein product [Mycena citricolor]